MSGIVRVEHDKDRPYTVVSKALTNDRRLSFRLRGMLTYLIGKPPFWEARMSEVESAGTEGEEAVRAMFAEGRKFGYIVTTARREKGRVTFDHVVYELPIDPPIPDILNEDGTPYVSPNKGKGKSPDLAHRTRETVPGKPGPESRVLVSNESISNQTDKPETENQSGQPEILPEQSKDKKPSEGECTGESATFFGKLCGSFFVKDNAEHLDGWLKDYSADFLALAWKLSPSLPKVRKATVGMAWLLQRTTGWPEELKRQYARDQKVPLAESTDVPFIGEVRVTKDGRSGRVTEVDPHERKLSLQIGEDAAESIWIPWAVTEPAVRKSA